MEKKDIDWGNLGFGYIKTDKRFVSNFKDGKWDDGALVDDDTSAYLNGARAVYNLVKTKNPDIKVVVRAIWTKGQEGTDGNFCLIVSHKSCAYSDEIFGVFREDYFIRSKA